MSHKAHGETETQIIERITLEEALALIQSNSENEDFVILDIRTPEEFANGHIENAINLNFYSLTLIDELDKLDKEKTYLIYCRTARRTGITLAMMGALGFREAYTMLGGITQWGAEGLPIIKPTDYGMSQSKRLRWI